MAYEPVWAIGTGRTATPQQAESIHGAIRGALNERFGRDEAQLVRILYGGSVNKANSNSMIFKPDIDGALVGTHLLKLTRSRLSFGRNRAKLKISTPPGRNQLSIRYFERKMEAPQQTSLCRCAVTGIKIAFRGKRIHAVVSKIRRSVRAAEHNHDHQHDRQNESHRQEVTSLSFARRTRGGRIPDRARSIGSPEPYSRPVRS